MIRRVRILDSSCEGEGNAAALSRSRASLENSLFMGNGREGATLLLERDAGTQIHRMTFRDNGGVGILVLGGAPQITRNVFANPGSPDGRAIGILVQESDEASTMRIDENVFEGCAAGEARVFSGELLSGDLRAARSLGVGRILRGGARFPADAGAFSGLSPLVQPEKEEGERPGTPLLGPTVPNPFHPQTTISYIVSSPAVVDLGVYNILGQRIRTLFAGDRSTGEYWETWDGRDDLARDMPPGVYYVRITQGVDTESQRIVLVR
jgi:hypothetical protein